MGNTVCVLPSQSSGGDLEEQLGRTENFQLQVHLSDVDRKCIVPPSEVEEAFLMQDAVMRKQQETQKATHQSATRDYKPTEWHGESLALVDRREESISLGSFLSREEVGHASKPIQSCQLSKFKEDPEVRVVETPSLFSKLMERDRGSVSSQNSVLHLKLSSFCGEYFQRRMITSLPNDLFTRNFARRVRRNTIQPSSRSRLDASTISSLSASPSLALASARPITLLATGQPLLNLEMVGRLGVCDRLGYGSSDLDKYCIIYNRRTMAIVALCAIKAATTGPPTMRVYTSKPRILGQQAAVQSKDLIDWPNVPLYTFCEVVTKGWRYPDRLRLLTYMAVGSSGKFERDARYQVEQVVAGGSDFRVTGRTDLERTNSGCAMLYQYQGEDDGDMFWRLSVVKGIDPVLMVCLASLVDESMQKLMQSRIDEKLVYDRE